MARVRRSLLRGKSFGKMTQLRAQKTPPGPALQESLAAFGVFAIRVGLVINKLPWTARFRCERSAAPMLRQTLLQICRETNVKTEVAFRFQYVNIEHVVRI